MSSLPIPDTAANLQAYSQRSEIYYGKQVFVQTQVHLPYWSTYSTT